MALITASQVNAEMTMPAYFTDENLKPYLKEATIIDLDGALGESFAKALVEGSGLAPYDSLITNADFVSGLAWFVYARYAKTDHIKATEQGIRIKRSNSSDIPSEEARGVIVSEAYTKARFYFRRLRAYLDANVGTFPEWSASTKAEVSPSEGYGFSIGKI